MSKPSRQTPVRIPEHLDRVLLPAAVQSEGLVELVGLLTSVTLEDNRGVVTHADMVPG